MIKAVANDGKGSGVLCLGFEISSLQTFKAKPVDTMVPVKAEDVGLAYGTLVFSAPDRPTVRRVTAALKNHLVYRSWSLIGLDFHTLDALIAAPYEATRRFDVRRRGFSHELLIFSGRDTMEMQDWFDKNDFIGPSTKIVIDPMLTN